MATNLHFCETREWLGAGQVGVVFQPCPLGFFFRTPMKMDTYLCLLAFSVNASCFLFFEQVCNELTFQAYFMRNYRARFCGSSATRVDHIVARELSRSLMVPRLWMAQVEVRKAVATCMLRARCVKQQRVSIFFPRSMTCMAGHCWRCWSWTSVPETSPKV
jgi:hypothetical protein